MHPAKPLIAAAVGLCIAVAAPAPPTRVNDPVSFVTDVYRHYMAAQSNRTNYSPPEDIYTPRLHELMAREDKIRASGDEGCLDFDFWINGQDWTLKELQVTRGGAAADREEVIAKFVNIRTPEEIHFDFRLVSGRWLLDDVRSLRGQRWTLSELLKCTP